MNLLEVVTPLSVYHNFNGADKKEIIFIFDIHLFNLEAVSESNNFLQRTKHIAIKYHHFPKIIQIYFIDTREQTVYIFPTQFYESLFVYIQRKLSGR